MKLVPFVLFTFLTHFNGSFRVKIGNFPFTTQSVRVLDKAMIICSRSKRTSCEFGVLRPDDSL